MTPGPSQPPITPHALYKSVHLEKSSQHYIIIIVISGVRGKISWGYFIQWHMVVICIWCALFVTSQFNVILMFPNQRFGEVC